MTDDIISLRGDRDLWLDFVHKVKKEKKQVWQVLSGLIDGYLKTKK